LKNLKNAHTVKLSWQQNYVSIF